jgi:tetratricopeptide (TPR) repeat protein
VNVGRQIRIYLVDGMNYYAAALLATGDWAQALAIYSDALHLAREVDMPDEQALALEGIGECRLLTQDSEDGAAYLDQALQIFRQIGMQPDAQRVEARLTQLGGI